MPGIGGVVVQFRADADKAIRETRKFIRQLDKVDGAAGKAGAGLKKGLAAGAVGVGAAIVGAGAALVQFGEAAVADAAAQSRLKKALENTTGATAAQVAATEEWITQQGIALGVADDELRPALARLARSTEDVGKAQELAGIAMDISAATGKPLQAVAEALAKAYDGNTGALKRMGIKLGEGKAGWEELAASVEGSAESQAESVEGTWDRIKLIFSEGSEALGGVVLKPLELFAEWLKDPKHIKDVEDFLANAAEAADAIGQDVVDRVKEFLAYVESPEGAANIKLMADSVRGLGDAFQSVGGFITDAADAYDRLPGWFKSLQGKAFEFLGKASLPGVLSRLGGSDPAAPSTGPARITSPSAPRQVSVTINNADPRRQAENAALAARLARALGD